MNTQFKAPAKYDDLLRLETTLVRTTNCTLEFNYVLFDQNATILTTASTVLVFQSLHQAKPIRIPEFIQTILKTYEIHA
jgi:acyl-CoA thioester hydrolase